MIEAPDLPAGASDETVALASVLDELGWLPDAAVIIDFFERPWKFEAIHHAWHRFGQPVPAEQPSRFEARMEPPQRRRDREQARLRWEQFRQHVEDLESVA